MIQGRDLGDENDYGYDRWRSRYVEPVAAYITRQFVAAALEIAGYGSEAPSPETRCPCGAGLNEPHAPDCWRNRPSDLAGATFDVYSTSYRCCGCWVSASGSWTCAQHEISAGMGV